MEIAMKNGLAGLGMLLGALAASPPSEVRRVHAAARQSALDAGLPDDAAYLEQSRSQSGVWTISDSYERFQSMALIYRNGQWFTRELTSGEPERGPISFEEAMSNATLFFHG